MKKLLPLFFVPVLFLCSVAIGAAPRKGPLKPVAVDAPPTKGATPEAVQPAESIQIEKKENWYDSFKLSGMIRVRPESKQNFGFDDTQKYDFVGQKTWLTAEKTFSDKSKAVVTLQDVRIWGGQNPTNTDTGTELQAVDVREAYLLLKNFFFTPFDLQVGRQKIAYGDEVLVGYSDWGNTGRSFDGIRFILDSQSNNLQIFSTFLKGGRSNDPSNPNAAFTNPGPNSGPGVKMNMYFSGIYDAWKIHPMFMLDTYFFARNQDNGITANQLYTGGFRISNRTEKGNANPKDAVLDYSINTAYQGGYNAGKKIEAYAIVGFLGVIFNAGVKMRVGGQGAYSSGGDNSGSTYHTFDPLYPTPHMTYGQADMVSLRNLTGFGADYTVWFTPNLNLRLDYWYAMRTSTDDGWYAVSGVQSATPVSAFNGQAQLYHEVDVRLDYKARDFLLFQAGYAYALRGKALKDANKNADYQYAYLMSTVLF